MGEVEEELVEALSLVFLQDEQVEGLDEDLVEYISGMLAAKVSEDEGGDLDMAEVLEEVLDPFLDSVQCPEHLVKQAQEVVSDVVKKTVSSKSEAADSKTTRKLTQGVVSMSSDLGGGADHEDDANRFLWGTSTGVKPMANDLIEAHADKTSAKEKRKGRKAEAEKERKLLSSKQDEDIDAAGGGLVRMNFRTVTGNAAADKARDVQVRNVTLSLDNGTVLLDSGDLKFSYQRRYGLIGENGVGKSTLLRAISKEDGIEGFPKHLRVLHVRQEVPSHLGDELTVMKAVLESDVERNMLLQEEREILARLEEDGEEEEDLSIQEKSKKLVADSKGLADMGSDLRRLEEVNSRLQMLGSESAESRVSMILSGLQFTHEMQYQPVSSLSGGWKMRVALAAALFIAPDLLMLDEPTNHLVSGLRLMTKQCDLVRIGHSH